MGNEVEVELKPCPFCGNVPEPSYTNNVNETYARLRHNEGCCLGLGETFRREHWIPRAAFEAWNARTTPSSPLTLEEAKERAREIVQTWHDNTEPRCLECTSPFSHEGLYSDIASELMAVATVPSVAGERLYSGDLWIDPDGTANFKFHIKGGDFTAARHALEKFITCLQDKLNRSEDCPYTERVLCHCDECDKDFYYSYESNVCPPCFQRARNEADTAAPSTPSSSAEIARRIAEKILDEFAGCLLVPDGYTHKGFYGNRWTDIIKSELAATSTETSWRDIDSAPKDGTEILLWWPYWRKRPVIGRWNTYQDNGFWDTEVKLVEYGQGLPDNLEDPLMWQPLPPLPSPPESRKS